MKQNLQFNTVLKFLITVGDLLIMNALFFFLYQLFDKATLGKGLTYSVPQILVLLNLVYLVCNYQNGVILYRRIVRPDHIIRKSLRNVGLLALVFTTLYALAHFGKLSVRFFLTFYLLFFVIQCVYRITVRILHSKRNDCTLASTQGQMSSPVMGIYFTATKGSITATEENPIILAVNNPSASTILTGMEIYQTAPVSGRADTDGYLGTATYDETSDSYQLKLTSGTLEGGYEFMIPTTRTVGAKQTEVVKEGTLDNSGNLTANKDVTINYTTQLGWEFKGEEASTLSSLLYNAILSHEGSEGMFDVTFDKKTQVSGESILYWKAVMNFNDVTYTFPTTEGNISATLTRYNGVDFTYTIEDGRHSGGTSNSGN